jgi:uncharacterized GH25 family protein
MVTGDVSDAVSGVPIDSARVYVTYLDVANHYEPRRMFECFTDENGMFRVFCTCHGFRIVEVEKDGYLSPPPVVVQGSGEFHFAMEPDTLTG